MDLDAQRQAAGLQPLIDTNPQPKNTKPEVVTEDATIGNERTIRGIPAVGRVSGTMQGTRPGEGLDRTPRLTPRQHYRA